MNKSVVIPDCPCCKFFHECPDKKSKACCDAFPDGIPNSYLFGPVQVKTLTECSNGFKYVEIEE